MPHLPAGWPTGLPTDHLAGLPADKLAGWPFIGKRCKEALSEFQIYQRRCNQRSPPSTSPSHRKWMDDRYHFQCILCDVLMLFDYSMRSFNIILVNSILHCFPTINHHYYHLSFCWLTGRSPCISCRFDHLIMRDLIHTILKLAFMINLKIYCKFHPTNTELDLECINTPITMKHTISDTKLIRQSKAAFQVLNVSEMFCSFHLPVSSRYN